VTLRELRGELGWQCARLAATARRALGIRRPSGIRELRAGERVYRQDTMVVTGRFVDEDQDGTDETLELDAALPLEFWRYEVCGALDAGSLRGGPSRRVTGREDGRTHVRYRFPVDSVRGAPRTSPRRLAVLAVPLAPRDPSGPYYPDQVWFGVFALPPGSRAD
jgi:hypothetical protein